MPENEIEDIKSRVKLLYRGDLTSQLWSSLVAAHIDALPWTINSIAGEKHLKQLYKVANESAFGETLVLTLDDELAASLTISSCSNRLPIQLIFQSAKGLLASFLRIPIREYLSLMIDSIQVNNFYRKQGSNSIKILTLFVLPDYRKKRLAKTILEFGLDLSLFSNSNVAFVDVNKDSTAAIKTYSSCGFSKSHETTRSIIMKKEISKIDKVHQESGRSLV